MAKLLQTLALITVLLGLPLLAKTHLFTYTSLWFVIACSFVLNMTQPSYTTKLARQRTPHDQYSMLALLLVGILMFVIPALDFAYLSQNQWPWHHPLVMLGFALGICGLAFRVWSIRVLGKFFTSKVEILTGHELIRKGPYKYFRHPSYTGTWIMALGVALALGSWLGVGFSAIALTAVYQYRIACEEKALLQEFGPKYEAYRKETWGLLPWLS